MADGKRFIGEILNDTNKMEDKRSVIEHLRKNNSQALKVLFEVAYHPLVQWALPPGDPPYQPETSPYGYHASNLYTETARFATFLKCRAMIPSDAVRERVFIQMLEAIPSEEAKLILAAKDRNLVPLYKWLSYELISEAFPRMLPERTPPVTESVVTESPLELSADGGATVADESPAPSKKPVKKAMKKRVGVKKTKTSTGVTNDA